MTSKNCVSMPGLNCGDCRMNALCLPLSLKESEIGQLDNIVKRGRPLQKDEHVYRTGEAFSAIYAVRSGTVKTYATSSGGQEQVTGFHLPGEIFGMDGIGKNRHTNSAIALGTAAICEIPFEQLTDLSSTIPSLQKRFIHLMGMEISNDQELINLLSKKGAEERVATLLINISNRHQARQLSPTHFLLPMSRSDIGNYLGLTLETVSRVFSRLQKSDILRVDKKEIEILNMDALKALTATCGPDSEDANEKAS
ncbi:MAG: fumarate/nitrate reduction transcriptional regulator Fnr [Pseudomonadales bacterium]|nr:fumarate/nitrate reduction transcriptional regulator Fnr [Pseudomonadales bacterium]MCP5173237.1 fumarate/nitrate reduction transcriptional regulator Fnr [Pseudomonadales bacterium]